MTNNPNSKIYSFKIFSKCCFKRMRFYVLIILLFSFSSAYSQSEKWILTDNYNSLTWNDFIKKIEKDFNINLYFKSDYFDDNSVVEIEKEISLISFLENNLQSNRIKLFVRDNNLFFYKGKDIISEVKESYYQSIVEKGGSTAKAIVINDSLTFLETSKEHIGKVIIIGKKSKSIGKSRVFLKGYVLDKNRKTALYGASVFIPELGIGTVSNSDGSYSLKLKKGNYTFEANEINHTKKKVYLNVLSNGKYNFLLDENYVKLDNVVITAESYDKIKSTRMGVEQMSIKFIKEIPLVMGERDILKVAQLLPGVQNVGEGSSGFNVRGSPVDQNLFYIDGIPVYNTSHFFGFFSVFNSDAISDFTLYKGNIPAQYGGRLASIFDIEAREGNNERFKVRGGISPITGKVMFEGPIVKNKSNYMVALRSTYSDWILKLINKEEFKKSSVSFADAIMKLTFNINSKDKIKALAYYSFDDINFAGKSLYDIENKGGTIKWVHFFKDNFRMNLALVHSTYELRLKNNEYALKAYSKYNVLQHSEMKFNIVYNKLEHHSFDFGFNTILYNIDRGNFLPYGNKSKIKGLVLGKEKGLESGAFLSDRIKINDKLTFLAGIRVNNFSFLGPNTVYDYKIGEEKSFQTIIDSTTFLSNDIIKSNYGIDYRLSGKYQFNRNFSIKGSFNRLHQYIFLLSNTIALSPNDSWKLSDFHISPMRGDQISLGLYSKVFNRKYEFSMEGYLKNITNLVEFKDGVDLLVTKVPEWDILQGDLKSYGVELMLKKTRGRLNGWVNYTYSKAIVQVNDTKTNEMINFGKAYPANYDKPHSLNFVFNYKILYRLSISTNFVYSTGKPITYPTSVYDLNNIKLINFTDRNAYRVPDYYRLDFSAKFEGNLKLKKKIHSVLVFSIYNVLGRHNVYNSYFKVDGRYIKGYKVSIFANPIVSLTYNFKFGNYEY